MRQNRTAGRTTRCGSQHSRNNRHGTQQANRTLEPMDARKDTVATPLQRGDATARAIDQVDQRNTIVMGQIFDKAALSAFAAGAAKCRTTANGEVFPAQRYRAAVYLCQPTNIRRG